MDSPASESTPLLNVKPATRLDNAGRHVIAKAFVLVVLMDFAGFFMDAPQTSILEDGICRRYYDSRTPEMHRDCSSTSVQTELATVTQFLNTFNLIPGLLIAVPCGILADRIGRRPVLVLSMIGIFLQDLFAKVVLWYSHIFPPRLIWATSAARLVGGGDAVASAMIYLIVADVAPASQRGSLFFLMSACILIGDIVGTPLSAFLMSKDPWIPYIISGALSLSGAIIAAVFLPETLVKAAPGPSPSSISSHSCPSNDDHTKPSAKWFDARSKIRPLMKRNVIAVLLAFFAGALGRQSSSFLLQYFRKRFTWSYQKASLLLALRGAINLVLLLVLLPALTKILAGYGWSADANDLFISRISICLSTLGSLLISASFSAIAAMLGVVLFALGLGFAPAARSLATSLGPPDEAGILYSALGLMSSIGGLVAGPVLAGSFRWGLSLGSAWIGMPFAVVAGLFGCGALALSFVCLQEEAKPTNEEREH